MNTMTLQAAVLLARKSGVNDPHPDCEVGLYMSPFGAQGHSDRGKSIRETVCIVPLRPIEEGPKSNCRPRSVGYWQGAPSNVYVETIDIRLQHLILAKTAHRIDAAHLECMEFGNHRARSLYRRPGFKFERQWRKLQQVMHL